MCKITNLTAQHSVLQPIGTSTKAAFKTRRLTPTTFVLTEYKDIYDEQPLIYVKPVQAAGTVLILDTGCGGATADPHIGLRSLRECIEMVPIGENGGKPLNEGGRMRYVVVLSHCHYDHILGVEQFAKDSVILASGHDASFVSPDNLPEHSLCEYLKIDTPKYTPTLVPHLHEIQSAYSSSSPIATSAPTKSTALGLTVLHTPGHTPDEIALWDASEHMLYVGDTLYQFAHIIFPTEGSIIYWFASVDALLSLVSSFPDARISCGHVTAGESALQVLRETKTFMSDVVEGKEKVRSRIEKRGEAFVEYVQEGQRYSLACPERLVEEARRALPKGQAS